MAHIFRVPINERDSILSCFARIPGIGSRSSKRICCKLGIRFESLKYKHLISGEKADRLNWDEKLDKAEDFLRDWKTPLKLEVGKQENQSIEYLVREVKSYKGIRHRKKLPVRGQRTHTNAITTALNTQKKTSIKKREMKEAKKKGGKKISKTTTR